MASNPYFNNFIPAGSQQAAGTQAYGAGPSSGYAGGQHSAPAAGQTSYDTAYPNTAAFAAGYYGFAPKPNYEPSKNYFPGPPGKPDGAGLPPAHYQGYEAALFNAAAAQAYLHHQSGPNKTSAPPKGGPKTRGRYSAGGGFQQRWTNSSTQQLHYCEVCKISCASPQTYKDHLDGQKHKKKEAAVRTGLPMVPTPRTGAALHCELCNVTCTSSDAYAAHIRGTKHQKVVKLHTKLGKPIPPAEPQLIHSKAAASAATSTVVAPAPVKVIAGAPKINFLGGNYLNTGPKANGNESEAAAAPVKKEGDAMTAAVATETALSVVAQWEEEKVIQPVGQDYVEELRGADGKITGFNCRLCDCRFNDVNAKDMHLKGRRHRLMYKKKVDPNLIVEAKGWPAQRQKTKSGAWQDKKRGEGYWEGNEGYEEMPPPGPAINEDGQARPPAYWASPSGRGGIRHGGHPIGLPPPPQYFPTGPMPVGLPNPAMRKPETSDDRHVLAKHGEIYPSDTELESIQTLVSHVERALKLVSDQLTHQPDDKTTPEEVPAANAVANQQPQRMLKGVMRVGLLAKGLLLKGDRTVQLVVLCSQPPTFDLMDRVAKALPAHLAVVAPNVTFQVETRPEEAHVHVKSVQGHGLPGDISVKVSLTSPVVREEQLAAAAAAAAAIAAGNDIDMKDATANKEGRLNTKDCLHALALLRRAKWFQARKRSEVWANLDLWAVELIVERACFSAGAPLSPGDALRRVFETLSAGILLGSHDGWSPGIGDPCEKDTIDATGNLTAQQREDMTFFAQQALRQIAFRQIFKVLGMSKPLPLGARAHKTQAAGPSPGKKRPRENSQSETVSPEGETPPDLIHLKKEKIEGQQEA